MKEIQTRSVHAGSLRPRLRGAVVTPIFQSSTFEYHGEVYHDVGYLRLSNSPNHKVLAARIAALEETESALVTGSGMAAISCALLSILKNGDHMLVQDCLYGGTTGLINHDLHRFGISTSVIDPQAPDTWKARLQKNTRLIYVETLTNPLVQLADLESVVAFARDHKLISVIDNTFASPVNCRPASLGFDLVVESCTKYMNGHTDLIAGSVAGSTPRVHEARLTLNHLGGSLDPLGCFLLERGLKTLGLRVEHQTRSAGRIAARLVEHPAIDKVNYPGLSTHPQHARAKRLLDGFGGMMSFELKGGVEPAEAFLANLELPAVAASLGGAESLIVRPAAAVHSALSPDERAAAGISDGLIRFSVGLEGTDDLLADLLAALDGATAGAAS
jgi:cystathionine beta-lyase/cystathionine gamma-synthase